MRLHTVFVISLGLGLLSMNNVCAQTNNNAPSLGNVADNVSHDMHKLSSEIEKFAELNGKCMQEKDEPKIKSCVIDGLNKLSDEGSFVAQHALGNYYEDNGYKEKAISLYNKALNNPNIIQEYKQEVQLDLDRVKK